MKTFVSGLALASLVSSSALAATTTAPAPGSSTTTATAETVARPKLIDKVTASLAGTFTGPSVAAMTGNDDNATASQTADNVGDPAGRINFDNVLRVGYKITPSSTLSGNMAFIYTPVMGEGVTMKDPYIQLANAGLVKSGNYSLTTAYRAYLPATRGSQLESRIAALRFTQSQSYAVGRWSLGVDSFLQTYFYGQNIRKEDAAGGVPAEKNNAAQVVAYVSPNLSYQITPTLAATVAYEAVGVHVANTDMTNWVSDGTYLYPGVSWDITPAVNLNPYLQLNSSRANPEAVLFGANFSAKFL